MPVLHKNWSFPWRVSSVNVTKYRGFGHIYWKILHGKLRFLCSARIHLADIYLFKVNYRNTRLRCEICSKLTKKTPEKRLQHSCFLVNVTKFLRTPILKIIYERLLPELRKSVDFHWDFLPEKFQKLEKYWIWNYLIGYYGKFTRSIW